MSKFQLRSGLSSIFLITLILFQQGCASIVSGKNQEFIVGSEPAGADVEIDELIRGKTPMNVELSRSKRHTIKLTHNGKTVTRATTRGFNWWYVGNLIFGGPVGLIVDPITGAIYKIKPEAIQVNFSNPDEILEKE